MSQHVVRPAIDPIGSAVSGPKREAERRSGRLHDLADSLAFVGLLNALIIAMTLAGGILLGLAPSLAAAAAAIRARLRQEPGSTTAHFVRTWRRQLVRANLLQAPAAALFTLLLVDLASIGSTEPVLRMLLIAALAVTTAYQVLLIVMDAHYQLRAQDALRLAGRFMVCAPAAPALLIATLTTIGGITWLLPGLLPVLSLGAAAHLCTALCLSFFASNDQRLAAQRHLADDVAHPRQLP